MTTSRFASYVGNSWISCVNNTLKKYGFGFHRLNVFFTSKSIRPLHRNYRSVLTQRVASIGLRISVDARVSVYKWVSLYVL